jgi:hypothetical protein
MRRLPLVALLAAASIGLSTETAAQAVITRVATLQTYAAFPQVGAETTVFGTVSSTPAGSAVAVQELRSGSWVEVGATTTDDAGKYTHTFKAAFSGTRSFRAVAPATVDLAKATSPTLSLGVRSKPKVQFDQAPHPTITGTHTVGSPLSIQFGTWSPDLKKYVQWIRDGTPISAYGYQYKLTAQDLGKHMTVMVYSFRSDSKTIRESRPGQAVQEGTFKTATPVITGEMAVGKAVTVSVSGWTPQPTTFAYQWRRNGDPIAGATAPQYTLTPDDAGTDLSVDVRGERVGYEPATRPSATVQVPGSPPASDQTFGDVMQSYSTSALPSGEGTVEATEALPAWGANQLTRWDASGAFTHSLTPKPMGTLSSAQSGTNVSHAPSGAEYVSTNSYYKNADVTFEFTGTRFAVEYRAHANSDAMVWIDGRPMSGSPIIGRDDSLGRRAVRQFVVVTLPERRTVDVRFAGPFFFTGVHTPAADEARITAAPASFTLGVLSDSYYENCYDAACMSRSGGPMLSTLTGFRVWNLSEGGTGYVNAAGGRGAPGYQSSPYGSARRLDAIKNAPIDALLVHGSYNDKTTWTPDQHRAALERFLDDVVQARPGLPVVIVGIEGASYSRGNVSHYSQLTSNFAGMVGRRDNVMGFIDGYSDPWLTGTGSTATPKGDGNQDQYIGSDGYHLNGPGQTYYQGRLTEELRDIPLPAGS